MLSHHIAPLVFSNFSLVFLHQMVNFASRGNSTQGALYTNFFYLLYILDIPPIRSVFQVTQTDPRGRDSSVGIVTDYELDGLGIESRLGRDFSHISTPALGPTQPPVQWDRVFPGCKAARA
jgi:hypothetical protein